MIFLFISKLLLSNFRNYEKTTISFSSNINVLYGRNGSGKTNVLEAINILSRGKSQRITKDNELIMLDKDAFLIKGLLNSNGYESTVQCSYNQGKGKKLLYNGQSITNSKELFSQLPTVSFLPENLDLIKGGPEQRRLFLDDILVVISVQYKDYLNRYSKVLYQRNQLLKDIRKKGLTKDALDSWDNQLIYYGDRIIKYRYKLLYEIRPFLQKNYVKLADSEETVTFQYINTLAEQGEDQYDKLLLKKREEDIARGYTSVGPHRDDLLLLINQQKARSFASQGQQRSIVLALKLAEVEYLAKILGRWPILLLDDVMSELDVQRRMGLVSLAKLTGQVFLTTTEKDHVPEELGSATYFFIDNGSIQRKD